MAETAINYLFPPDKIHELPTWRFVLHFKAPLFFRGRKCRQAFQALKQAKWKIIEFPCDFDGLEFEPRSKTVGVPIEVSEEKRHRPDSLSDYESDVWKIYGNMLEFGFGDLYYEAVDWQED